MAIEICNVLAIYFAQQLKGVFRNQAITFSGHPEFIDLQENTSLKEKLMKYSILMDGTSEKHYSIFINQMRLCSSGVIHRLYIIQHKNGRICIIR